MIGSAPLMLRPPRDFGKRENIAALRREMLSPEPLPVLYGERSKFECNSNFG
jgi:hypothetical protein